MPRFNKNSNEKSKRNRDIFEDRENGSLIVELSKKYDISIPRVHRICMQEEIKVLKTENIDLKDQLKKCIAKK